MQEKQNTYFADTKPHFKLLDGLRGVAALMVVWYHVFEGFGFAGAVNGISDGSITTFNHGYLAVDFFFMLSGFVISYAYDSRWRGSSSSITASSGASGNVTSGSNASGNVTSGSNASGNVTSGSSSSTSTSGGLTLAGFFKRRLIRLHPMVMMGAIIGAISFCIGGCTNWMGETISWQNIALALALGMLLIPAWPGARFDVRGNGEMYPLNGPSWSLFFEYLGNILYAIAIRKLSTKNLKLLTAALGLCYATFAITNTSGYGSIGVGWTLDHINFPGGLIRMLFPFTLGMLIRRTLFAQPASPQATQQASPQTTQQASPQTTQQTAQPASQQANGLCVAHRHTLAQKHSLASKHAFALCSALLFAIFSVPFLGASEHFSLNGIYETLCIAVIFPAITILAARSSSKNNSGSSATCSETCSATCSATCSKTCSATCSATCSKTCSATCSATCSKTVGAIAKYLGDLSYPLYIVHYPIMYLFYKWLIETKHYTLSSCWPAVILVLCTSLALATVCLKLYDQPLRKQLAQK